MDLPERLADRLLAEGQKTLDFFRVLSPEQWEKTVYTEGSCWTIRQVLAHFVVAEAGFAGIVRNVLAGGTGAPEDINLDAYNERTVAKLSAAGPAELLGRYEQLRREFASRVREMSPEDLAKTGRHPFLGVAPLEGIVKLLYRHNGIHIRDIRRVLG